MALDKLVDSTQLDADLTSVANAIRTKGGASAQLAFPADFVSEIGNIPSGGGDPSENLKKVNTNILQSLEVDWSGSLKGFLFFNCTSLQSLKIPNINTIVSGALRNTGLSVFVGQSVELIEDSGVAYSSGLTTVDIGSTAASYITLRNGALRNNANLNTLIFRRTTDIVRNGGTNVLFGTKFASGGAGGTIYIPKVMYDHLGDGGSLDYKAATGWSTLDGYGTITWAKIEGSIYETQYADGTPIA